MERNEAEAGKDGSWIWSINFHTRSLLTVIHLSFPPCFLSPSSHVVLLPNHLKEGSASFYSQANAPLSTASFQDQQPTALSITPPPLCASLISPSNVLRYCLENISLANHTPVQTVSIYICTLLHLCMQMYPPAHEHTIY